MSAFDSSPTITHLDYEDKHDGVQVRDENEKDDEQSDMDLGDDLDMDGGSENGEDASDAEDPMEEDGGESGDTAEDDEGAQGGQEVDSENGEEEDGVEDLPTGARVMGEGDDPDDPHDPDEGETIPTTNQWPKLWQNPLRGSDLEEPAAVEEPGAETVAETVSTEATLQDTGFKVYAGNSDRLLLERLELAEKIFEEQQKQLTKMLQDLAEVKTKMEIEHKSKQVSEQSLDVKNIEARKKLKEELEEEIEKERRTTQAEVENLRIEIDRLNENVDEGKLFQKHV